MTTKYFITYLNNIVLDLNYGLVTVSLGVDSEISDSENSDSENKASVNNGKLIKELIFSSLIEVFTNLTLINILKSENLVDLQITGMIKLSTGSGSQEIVIPLFIIEDALIKLGKLEGSPKTFIVKECLGKEIGIGFDDITLENYLHESIQNINDFRYFEDVILKIEEFESSYDYNNDFYPSEPHKL